MRVRARRIVRRMMRMRTKSSVCRIEHKERGFFACSIVSFQLSTPRKLFPAPAFAAQ